MSLCKNNKVRIIAHCKCHIIIDTSEMKYKNKQNHNNTFKMKKNGAQNKIIPKCVSGFDRSLFPNLLYIYKT